MFELRKNSYISLDELFCDWKRQHLDENEDDYLKYKGRMVPQKAFLPDGIIDEEKFSEKKREGKAVLFIAKEAYWYSDNLKEEEYEEKMGNPMFWHKEVAYDRTKKTMFSQRLSLLINSFYADDYKTVNKDHKNLQSCSIINLNKRGGYAYSKWNTLEGYVKQYAKYIEKEIEIINPDVIICCGGGVKWLLDKYISISEKVKVVEVSHPSYFALKDLEYLNQLKCAINGEVWHRSDEKNEEKSTKREMRGIMFDTNKTYYENATFDMLLSGKISAYDGAGKYIERFNVDDMVFYYVKGRDVVAAGEICSEAELYTCDDFTEKYKMVNIIVPKKMPTEESGLKNVSAREIEEMFKRKFRWAITAKVPYLSKEWCTELVGKLKELYNE